MPTFSAVAFERLIEPGPSPSSNKSSGDSNYTVEVMSSERRNGEKKLSRIQITPALYVTPEATPVPDSPTSYTPSPYIVNHKRRGPRLAVHSSKTESQPEKNDDASSNVVVKVEPPSQNGEAVEVNSGYQKEEEEYYDFFDPQETGSCASGSSLRATEFYDAWDELSNDGSYHISSKRDYEAELSAMKMSMEEEQEKRKEAEEALSRMVNQWRNMKEKLALAGISFQDSEPEKEICEQFDVARFVSQSIGRGIVKAEMGIELETEVSRKNVEISRLLDRVRYYEAMNREMCEWNQEELRRKRVARRKQQRLMWGTIAAAIVVGGAGLAWSYIGSSESGQRDSSKDE